MPNDRFMRGPQSRGSVACRPSRDYANSYGTRQDRFETRTAMRYGDWGILEIPTAMLWFDEIYAEIEADDGYPEPVIIDLWP